MQPLRRALFSGQVLLTGILLNLLTGCATKTNDLWNARVGQYTYDQAVQEYGPPDKSATLTDGTLVAEWLRRRGGSYAAAPMPMYYYHYRYRPYYPYFPDSPIYYQAYTYPDTFLRLTFGPDKVLKSWHRFYK